MIRVATFNANGIRAAMRRGFGDWLVARDCDVVAIQEMRCGSDDVPALPGYHLTYEPASTAARSTMRGATSRSTWTSTAGA